MTVFVSPKIISGPPKFISGYPKIILGHPKAVLEVLIIGAKPRSYLRAVDWLNLTVNDPPEQEQLQTIADKLDEIRRNAKRQ